MNLVADKCYYIICVIISNNVKYGYKVWNKYFFNVFERSSSKLKLSVSHDSSEIILICLFGAQLLSVINGAE